ncbi:hypothetical protein V8G54_015325 [Vigna mungo]|uniref:Uncharacterized protein n=1 Tax=Vigna mungo TaxID=3915 RepID=A0AAQ3NKY6_VIGMU
MEYYGNKNSRFFPKQNPDPKTQCVKTRTKLLKENSQIRRTRSETPICNNRFQNLQNSQTLLRNANQECIPFCYHRRMLQKRELSRSRSPRERRRTELLALLDAGTNLPAERPEKRGEERNLLSCETQTPTETRKTKPPLLPYKNPNPKPENETKNNASLSLQPERHQKQEKE